MKLQEIINHDLIQSMKAQHKIKTSVLRGIKSALKNKEIMLGRPLSEGEVLGNLLTLVKQRKDSIEQFSRGCRQDLVNQETAELKILQTYVPEAVDEAEIEAVISRTIQTLQISTVKDLGKVMKAVMVEFSGKNIDGKTVSNIVKKRLGA